MNYQKIGLCVTDRCTAACRMCCLECSPARAQHLDPEIMRFYIREAGSIPGATVGFTGGEALLYYDEVLRMTRYACSLGVRTTLNTNGFWGRNEKLWLRRMGRLRDAGLSAVYFSTDCWHQEYVPPEDLKKAIQITHALQIPSRLFVMETAASHNMDTVKREFLSQFPWIQAEVSVVLPVGRGREFFAGEPLPAVLDAQSAGCPFDRVLQVGNDRNVYMCCSPCAREIPVLNLGRAGEDPLRALVRKIMHRDALYILLKEGLGWFYRQALRTGRTPASRLASSCQLCMELLGDPGFMEEIGPEIAGKADALRSAKILERRK